MPVYCGKKIIIKGRLLDQNCVPVSDAKIYMWQVDCDGKYPYETLRDKVDKNLINTNNASSFKGSGTATTNNLGEFYFITTYPPSVDKEKPSVNIRADHRMLGTLQTKLILSASHIDDLQDDLDEVLSAVIDDTEIYSYDITIRGESLSRF
jgi:protocatechuate 3,4-dioxygenase, beta subunit